MRAVKDSDGNVVKAGDFVRFAYGQPPVGVRAPVVERDGDLVALTPDHNPTECRVDHLIRHVGAFWIITR